VIQHIQATIQKVKTKYQRRERKRVRKRKRTRQAIDRESSVAMQQLIHSSYPPFCISLISFPFFKTITLFLILFTTSVLCVAMTTVLSPSTFFWISSWCPTSFLGPSFPLAHRRVWFACLRRVHGNRKRVAVPQQKVGREKTVPFLQAPQGKALPAPVLLFFFRRVFGYRGLTRCFQNTFLSCKILKSWNTIPICSRNSSILVHVLFDISISLTITVPEFG